MSAPEGKTGRYRIVELPSTAWPPIFVTHPYLGAVCLRAPAIDIKTGDLVLLKRKVVADAD